MTLVEDHFNFADIILPHRACIKRRKLQSLRRIDEHAYV